MVVNKLINFKEKDMQEIAKQAKIIMDQNEAMDLEKAIGIALDDSNYDNTKASMSRVKGLYFRAYPKKPDAVVVSESGVSEEEESFIDDVVSDAVEGGMNDALGLEGVELEDSDNEDEENEKPASETAFLLSGEDFYDDSGSDE